MRASELSDLEPMVDMHRRPLTFHTTSLRAETSPRISVAGSPGLDPSPGCAGAGGGFGTGSEACAAGFRHRPASLARWVSCSSWFPVRWGRLHRLGAPSAPR